MQEQPPYHKPVQRPCAVRWVTGGRFLIATRLSPFPCENKQSEGRQFPVNALIARSNSRVVKFAKLFLETVTSWQCFALGLNSTLARVQHTRMWWFQVS